MNKDFHHFIRQQTADMLDVDLSDVEVEELPGGLFMAKVKTPEFSRKSHCGTVQDFQGSSDDTTVALLVRRDASDAQVHHAMHTIPAVDMQPCITFERINTPHLTDGKPNPYSPPLTPGLVWRLYLVIHTDANCRHHKGE